jgi:hypothetical protein
VTLSAPDFEREILLETNKSSRSRYLGLGTGGTGGT